MSFDPATNKLTLKNVSPVTVFFTDRPERIAGNMNTTKFIPFWSDGKDSFKSDPPNADISIIEGKTLKQTVVELQDPVLDGDNLSYTESTVRRCGRQIHPFRLHTLYLGRTALTL